ncbi:hypothetical protein EDB92DRAFT_1817538 [Lactarius akahatsu]|uniref:Uncharacterized protein n=1 Tax=Lactarius akahatsu TaxID=416441 RepID=A0AAD4LG70_9AGAM|nr:hypothetical protein EDB92DRAFT_1817538 [Lactarius akahatsu]
MPHATSRNESSGCFERTSVALCSIRTVLTPAGRSGSLAGAGKARDTCDQPVMCGVAGQGRRGFLVAGRTGSGSHAGQTTKGRRRSSLHVGLNENDGTASTWFPGSIRCVFVPHRAKFPPPSRRRSRAACTPPEPEFDGQGPIPVNIVKPLARATIFFAIVRSCRIWQYSREGTLEELMWLRRHRERGLADGLGWEVGVRKRGRPKVEFDGPLASSRNNHRCRHGTRKSARQCSVTYDMCSILLREIADRATASSVMYDPDDKVGDGEVLSRHLDR